MMQSRTTPFFQTWVDALTKPSEQTYAGMAASPRAKATTAYLWVFIGSILASFLTLIVQGALIRSRLSEAGVTPDQFGGGVGAVALTLLCGAPIAAAIATFFFAVGVAIVQWVAKMFGGRGSNDQLAYTFAAISAPYSIITGLFVLLSAIPYVGFCFRIILWLAGIYILVLEVMAVKGVNQFGWGPALGSVFIPFLAVVLICCCAAAVVAALTGAAIGNIFSTINSSLMP